MPIPTCECNAGQPLQTQLANIYCALLEIIAGQGGGDITLSQISDLDASWISPLQNPLANFSITASQISDATTIGTGLITLTPPVAPRIIQVDDQGLVITLTPNDSAQFIAEGPVFTGTTTPVTSGTASNGILTDLS